MAGLQRTLRALLQLSISTVQRTLREGLVVRSVVSPAIIAGGTLAFTVLVLMWWRPPRDVGVAPDTPPEVVQALTDDGYDVVPVPDARRAVEDHAVPAATDGRALYVLGIATHGLAVERTLRTELGTTWWPDPPDRLPSYERAQEMGQRVCPALAVFFVLYGVVFGLGSIARDTEGGILDAEFSLPIPRWVPPFARWLAATAVLSLFYALCVALVAAMVGVTDLTSTVVHGAAACAGSTAIGLAVVGARGIRAAFSGPFALGITAATALLGVGATPLGPYVPVASVVGGGTGWLPLALGVAAGWLASWVCGWRIPPRMRWPRPRRVWAVARRDLAMELNHRRGWVLPVVMAALLLPTSMIRGPEDREAATGVRDWYATGDVPEGVQALDQAPQSRRAQRLHFFDEPDGLRVRAEIVPAEVRRALDGDTPQLEVSSVDVGFVFPGRTMFLALIATSSLTGALSSSVGGERSNRTLVALLTSSLTRLEIVLGKWAAWGGFGAACSLAAAALALALGRVELGWWILPLPWVPLVTVALGLTLVRRATDVVAGSAVSMRVLPAALTVTGLIAWFLTRVDPHLGALVPLGGALIGAGDVWRDTPTAPLLAAASSAALTALWLGRTSMDLDERPAGDLPPPLGRLAAGAAFIGAMCWWVPVGMALLWREAGNPALGDGLPLEAGVQAGTLGLACFALVRLGKASRPRDELGLLRPTAAALGLAVVVGVVLGLLGPALPWSPLDGVLDDLRARMASAWLPTVGGPLTVGITILVDELLFRGWLQRAAGPGRAALVWVVVKAPLDPVHGLLVAAGLGAVAHRGGVWASVVARLVLWGVFAALWA